MAEMISEYHLERVGYHIGDSQNSIPLKIGANTIGRLPTNQIAITSKYVSRKHCSIHLTEDGQITVKNIIVSISPDSVWETYLSIEIMKNFQATNGIFINGLQIFATKDEISLNLEDSLGIGCDTSPDEIIDPECFIFKVKRNKCEENGVDDVICLLDDSDEEEECRREYSQMNISEMKQEYMGAEELVEEYSIKSEPVGQVVSVRNSDTVEIIDGNLDVFEKIIASSSKSYAEKTGLIKNIVPDVASILMKDCSAGGDGGDDRMLDETLPTKRDTKNDAKVKTEKVSTKETKKTKDEVKTGSSRKHHERKSRKRESHPAKDKSDRKTRHKTKDDSLPSPQIKELHIKISLRDINCRSLTPPSTLEPTAEIVNETPRDNLNKSTESRISNRRNTYVPSSHTSNPPKMTDSNKSPEVTHSKITHRRNTFVPSSTLCSGPTKRQLEIINAPHMPKRRKSILAVPETPKTKHVNKDEWLSKKVSHKKCGRSKEELKAKLAALVPDPKDKVVEVKVRTNTKIPVKNTHKTRSDQLTDTIVTTATPTTRKHKISENGLPTELCKKLRMTENEIAKDKPNIIQLRRPSFVANRPVEKCTVVKQMNDKPVHNGTNQISKPSCSDLIENINAVADASPVVSPEDTSPTVKSILKRSNSIQKRRATVTFAEAPRIKIISSIESVVPVVPVAPEVVRNEEENIDDVIHNIMSLGMAALKESSGGGTINGKNFAYKTVADEYDSLRHLQR